MLLLTAAPGVQEWQELVDEVEMSLAGSVASHFQEMNMLEHYVTVRDRDGEYRRVTHWTRNGNDYCSSSDRADELGYMLNTIGSELGSGHFSSVFECPWDDTKAIKIGVGPGSTGEIFEDGWLDYAAFCMKKQAQGINNPILPTIHKLYISSCDDFFIALLDKYDHEWSNYHGDQDDPIYQQYRGIQKGLNEWHKPDKTVCQKTLKWAKALYDDPDWVGCGDMHGGNLMVLDDRLILTDPCGRSDANWQKQQYILRQIGVLMADVSADAEYENEKARRDQRDRHRDRANDVKRRKHYMQHNHQVWIMNAEGQRVEVVEHSGQAVLTFDMIDHALQLMNNNEVKEEDAPVIIMGGVALSPQEFHEMCEVAKSRDREHNARDPCKEAA